MTKLHVLTEKIIDFNKPTYDGSIGHVDILKLNTIIVEWLEEAASPLRGCSDDLCPEFINECLGLSAPDTLLERELTHFLNLTPVHQGSLAATHAKAAIAYLREKDLLR